jgi:arsenite/tail-anchored protein-transporting ATPase
LASKQRAKERTAPPQQYVFFGGKGGVGKTTCAAAAAFRLADAGHRVLIVSTDPAHSLGDALAIRLSSKTSRVTTKRGSLHAAELDADNALIRWMKQRQRALETIAEHGTYLDAEDIEQLLRLSLPGVDELVGLVELRRIARSGDYDHVVVDTAPTGHTLRLLAMPATLRRIATVFDDMQAKHRFLAESLGGRYRSDAGDELIAEIEDESRELMEILQDPEQARFAWVLLPEMLAIEETKDGLAALQNEGIAVGEIIVNRVRRATGQACPACERRLQAERAAIRAIQTMASGFRESTVLFVPQQEKEPRGVAALRTLQPVPRIASDTPRKQPVPRKVTERQRPTEASEWADVVAPPGCRLLLFGGKGGVGKTTCAAACALVLSERDRQRRILLLSTDPAHSLGDVLQLPLGDRETALPGFPALRARELDAQSLFHDRRERYLESIDELFDSLQGSSHLDAAYDRAVARDLIDLSPPGLDEIFGILSVSDALLPGEGRAPEYDLVVVDTAPTGHALRLLEMPAKALQWVHTLLGILLKYRKVTGLGGLASDLLDLARQMRQFLDLLHDSNQTRLVAVTRAAKLPTLETARLLNAVKKMKISVSAVLVNAVTKGTCAHCRRAAAVEQREIQALPAAHTRLLADEAAPPPRGIGELRSWAKTWQKTWQLAPRRKGIRQAARQGNR